MPASVTRNLYDFNMTISDCPASDDFSLPPPLDGQFSGLGTILPRSFAYGTLVISLYRENRTAVMVIRR
jgi:hypothetical protein